ncbi:MAG: histidine kinase [Rubrivivax sp.]|nr:histidine kinase [Rubrivivax sp.]
MSAVLPTDAEATGAAAAAATPKALGVTPQPLDEPLPDELTGRGHGWLTAYRRYPVFGPTWARQRLRRVGVAVVATMVALIGLTVLAERVAPWAPISQVAISILLPLLLGPWLGSRARVAAARRGWSPRTEFTALAGAVLASIVAVTAFGEWGAEPVKQQVAEWTGQVDESGQRTRIALMIGVTIRPAEPEAGAAMRGGPGSAAPRGTAPSLTTHIAHALLSFCLAGGFALPRWRREREDLATLARQRELARAQAAQREAELRLSVLAAQVEPHFLFNTLAGVRSAIATDPGRASEMVDRLVEYLRAAIPRLRSDGGADATLGSQLEIVQAYLGLMAARMPRLAWSVDVAPELRALPFPPLMLISLAENAVKHGVEPKIGPARVLVQARRSDDGRLAVTVADDGAGFGASSGGGGLGLVNIRERLQQMYGQRATLELRARPEGGVAATITLPTE